MHGGGVSTSLMMMAFVKCSCRRRESTPKGRCGVGFLGSGVLVGLPAPDRVFLERL